MASIWTPSANNPRSPSPDGLFFQGPAMPKRVDLTGQRFGKLVAVRAHVRQGIGRVYYMWECICDCGGVITTRVATLRNGSAKSCGCLQREAGRKIAKANIEKTTQYACEMCGTKFMGRKNKIRKYCSMQCTRKSELKPHPSEGVCDVCGKKFRPRRKGVLQLRCSRRCANLAGTRKNTERAAMGELLATAKILGEKINEQSSEK